MIKHAVSGGSYGGSYVCQTKHIQDKSCQTKNCQTKRIHISNHTLGCIVTAKSLKVKLDAT